MDTQDPRIIDLDPDHAPRTSAIILIGFVVLGIGFVLVNMVFTGDDQYYIQGDWDDGKEPTKFERYDFVPNVWRDKAVQAQEEEDLEPRKSPGSKKPATNPTGNSWTVGGTTRPAGGVRPWSASQPSWKRP